MKKTSKFQSNIIIFQKEIARLKDILSVSRGYGLSVEKLKSEHDFLNYVELLKKFAKRYTVMIAASDTPCGMAYTQEVSHKLMGLGLKVDLFEKFRFGYVAVLDAGELVFEQIAPSTLDIVEYKGALNGSDIELLSVGFNAPQGNAGIIKINGKNHSPNKRGLNFVVYDKVTKFVLDAVNFDTFSNHFACHRPSELLDGVSRFRKKHPDVSFVCFNTLGFPQENLTQNEQFILSNAVGRATILNNLDKPVFALNRYYDAEGIVEVLNAPRSYHDINGVRRFEDTHGKCVNTAGGHRITAYQPKQHRRTIFILGECRIFGVGSSDEHTIASFLQKLFNEQMPEQSIVVQNYGFYLAEMGDAQTGEELAILESLPVKPGDMVLWNFHSIPEVPFIDISRAAMHPRTYEIFFDTLHYTPDGNRVMAEKLFEELTKKNLLEFGGADVKQTVDNDYGFDRDRSNELTEYKKILVNFYEEMFSVKMGAVVVNCNPFTLGHRYLIEQALSQCDYLAVFVVQEDRSVFPFEDRIRMVDMCTSDLQNVVVIPSGSFIISSLTFSEYFNKSEMQDRVVDSSLDVTLFAREIAPCLHITKRFAGEEPSDTVTSQYNETMKRILPEYGIEFVEIPRKKIGKDVVSASYVRNLLEQKDFDGIRPLVPEMVFEYLIEKFK